MAKERGLTYVKLDGDIGILGNGAGLVMSTLDVVAQYGGEPANFLDAGGGSKAEAITSAVEVILSDPKVKAVLFNIFGGITRCDEVANGLIEAFNQINADGPVRRPPGRHQRRGGPADPRRGEPAQRAHRGDDGRGRREGRGAGGGRHERPGRQRHQAVRLRHHRPRGHVPRAEQPALRHATSSRASRRARAARTSRASRSSTRSTTRSTQTGANTAMVFVPPRFAADSILEAADAGIDDDHRDHRGHPRPRRAARLQPPLQAHPGHAPDRPQLPGRAVAGQGERRDHPGLLLQGGQRRRRVALGHADLPDRQRAGPARLRQLVDRRHRRRPGPGLVVHRHHRAVRGRPRDRADRHERRDRRLGRGGGRRVHRRARHQAGRRATSPASPRLRARRWATPARSSSGSQGTAAAKAEALEANGVRVGRTPTQVAEIAVEILQG